MQQEAQISASAELPAPAKGVAIRSPRRSFAFLYVSSLAAGTLVWELVARQFSSFVLATPTAVVERLYEMSVSGALPTAVGIAMLHMVAGYLIACAIALPVGLAMGRNRFVYDLLDPIVNLVYAVPSIAWVPFIMIWFGLQYEARVALVVMMCVFDMIIVISTGARNAERRYLDVGRSFGASGWQRLRLVLLPESLPFLFTALRIGVVRAVNAMITAELFLAAAKLGSIMKHAAVRLDSAAVLGVLAVLCVLGLVFQELLLLAERRLCSWQQKGRP